MEGSLPRLRRVRLSALHETAPERKRVAVAATRRIPRSLLALLLTVTSAAFAPTAVFAQAAAGCGSNLTDGGIVCGSGAASGGPGGATGAMPAEPAAAPASLLPQSVVGNPLDLMTGSKRQAENDFAVPGAALVLNRTYNSANADHDVGLGHGWHHSYALILLDAGGGSRELIQGDGRRLRFAPAGTDAEGRPLLRGGTAAEGTLTVLEENRHEWRLGDGRRLRFRGSHLVDIHWPDQRHLSMFYRQRRLASVTDESGRVLRLEYTAGRSGLPGYERRPFGPQPGTLARVVLPDGRAIGYDYDERYNLTRVRYPDGTSREYHYEAGEEGWPHHLTGLTDRTGKRVATWEYDGHGRAILSEGADGAERVSLVHPDPQAIERGEAVETRVTNAFEAESAYRWVKGSRADAGGAPRLLGGTGPGCATCPATGVSYGYDAAGRLTNMWRSGAGGSDGSRAAGDPDGTGDAPDPVVSAGSVHTEHVYDAAGRLAETWRTDASGRRVRAERREYAGESLLPALVVRPSVNPAGERRTRIERDEHDRVTTLVESGFAPFVTLPGETAPPEALDGFVPIERVTRFTHDERGRLVAIDGPREDVPDVTRLEWDDSSRLLAVHPPASPSLRLGAFDALGRPTEIRIARARLYRIGYGAGGEIVTITHRGTVTRLAHDAEGRLVEVTDADGRRTRLERDAAGRVQAVHDPFGRTVRRAFDAEGRESRRTVLGLDGQLIGALSMVHDAYGRPSRPGARSGARSGDGDGLGIDGFGRLAALAAPDDTTARPLRDARGRPAGLVDARGNVTRELRDDFGALVGIVSPDTGTERLERDPAGKLLRRVREDSGSTDYRRDAAGRIVERRTANGEVTTWTYDEASGRLVNVGNASTTERFEHDEHGQLLRHVREIDGHRFETAYAYDARGRLALKTLPGGARLRHHYHEDGPEAGTLRAIVRERWLGLGAETLVAEIDLEARDGASGHLAANGLRTQRRFAPDGTLRTLRIGGALAAGYTFDDAGRLVRVEENGAVHRYGYAGRHLVSADTPGATYRYAYDAAGNRTERRMRGSDGSETHQRVRHAAPGEGNRPLAVSDGRTGRGDGAERRYVHDPGGSPTRVGDLRYAYDAHRRPVSLHRGDTLLATYAYNAFGERVKKVVHRRGRSPETTYFLYDSSALVAEADGDGRIDAEYVYLPDGLPVVRLDGDEVHAIHTDHRGAPRLASDRNGEIVWRASYTPFGEAKVATGTRIALPLRLPGQYADAESGTHHNYYRDYDPATGRYLSGDPLGLAAGANAYAYVGGDPLGAIDPLGLAAVPLTPLTIGATLAGTGAAAGWLLAAVEAGVASVAGGVVAIGAGPVVATIGVAALAVYFYREYGGRPSGESDFADEFGGKPAASDYRALQTELVGYAPWLGSPSTLPGHHDGSWTSYFEMARQLEDAQRTFIADYEGTYGSGYCPLPEVRERYEGAVVAVAMADASPEAADGAGPVPGTWTGDGNEEECARLNAQVQAAKQEVRRLGKCRIGMSRYDVKTRRIAWLNEAQARSRYHQKCWAGGNQGHQAREADAWSQVGACDRLL